MIVRGDAIDLIQSFAREPDLVVTDPPYALGGGDGAHRLVAAVAVVLHYAGRKLKRGGWMIVMCASSWRSTVYMVTSLQGVVEPVRIATWCKPVARTKVTTAGWRWASVNVIAFRKGPPRDCDTLGCELLDHITAAPLTQGRRAELPPEVADWLVQPFASPGGLLLDPFAGSGAILAAGERAGMEAIGFERAQE